MAKQITKPQKQLSFVGRPQQVHRVSDLHGRVQEAVDQSEGRGPHLLAQRRDQARPRLSARLGSQGRRIQRRRRGRAGAHADRRRIRACRSSSTIRPACSRGVPGRVPAASRAVERGFRVVGTEL